MIITKQKTPPSRLPKRTCSETHFSPEFLGKNTPPSKVLDDLIRLAKDHAVKTNNT
jgi:hypothetical protein